MNQTALAKSCLCRGQAAVNRLLSVILVFVLLLPLGGLNAHTPYGQWDVFRVRHLQVLTARTDLVGDALADEWVAILREHLPKSKAVVSRARDFIRVASLLKTDQAKVALLSHELAEAMLHGTAPFEEFGAMPLQLLLDDGTYVLVARSDLPEDHGYLVVSTLLDEALEFNVSVPRQSLFDMPVHPGASRAAAEHSAAQ